MSGGKRKPLTIWHLIGAVTAVMLVLYARYRVPWQLVPVIDLCIYLRWAYTHPYRPHRACGGTGRNALSTKRRRGECRRCGSSGTKLAWDYRILRGIFKGAASTRKQLKGK